MQDYIYNLITNEKEVTWQSIIQDLVRTEQMDPWDINISLLVKKYLETVKKLEKLNFFVSGKILLASAFLLKIKSDKLMNEHITNFDSLFYPGQEEFEEFVEETKQEKPEIPNIYIKTPQARKKKVTLNELITALNKAINVNEKRILRKIREENLFPKVLIPVKTVDITALIKEIYSKIKNYFLANDNLTFSVLVNSERREDKIRTFVPLLHLENDNKVELTQLVPFGEIDIKLKRKSYY